MLAPLLPPKGPSAEDWPKDIWSSDRSMLTTRESRVMSRGDMERSWESRGRGGVRAVALSAMLASTVAVGLSKKGSLEARQRLRDDADANAGRNVDAGVGVGVGVGVGIGIGEGADADADADTSGRTEAAANAATGVSLETMPVLGIDGVDNEEARAPFGAGCWRALRP